MHVCITAPAATETVGFTRYAAGIADGLEALGHTVDRVGVRKREFHLAGRPFLGDTLLRRQARAYDRRVPADAILHASEPTLATPRTDVVTVHDAIPLKDDPSWLPGPVGRAYARRKVAALRYRHVVVPTHAVKDDLLRLGVAPRSLTVTYEGVDTTRFHPDTPHPGMAAPGFHVLLVGDMNPRKGWGLLVQAARDLPDVHVWHAGPTNRWTAEAARVEAAAAPLGARWHRLGTVDDDTLRSLYSGCDLFALPSADEGFGLPPLEALACGAPVLASDIPVLRETLGDMARFTARDPDGLRAAIETERTEGPVADRQRRLAHAARYTWEAAAAKTVGAYRLAEAGR